MEVLLVCCSTEVDGPLEPELQAVTAVTSTRAAAALRARAVRKMSPFMCCSLFIAAPPQVPGQAAATCWKTVLRL